MTLQVIKIEDATPINAALNYIIPVSVPGQDPAIKYGITVESILANVPTVAGGNFMYVNITEPLFGAIPNSPGQASANTTKIQAAIDHAVANGYPGIHIPFGTFYTQGPLMVYKLSGSNYAAVTFCVTGSAPTKTSDDSRRSAINCLNKTTFCIGFQNARACTIQNVELIGSYLSSSGAHGGDVIREDRSLFRNHATSNGTRFSTYSPYSGVVVTPFSPSVPSDGGYPGMSSWYRGNAQGSSGVLIRDCRIRGFMVDVMIAPNQSTNNDESIHIERCRLYDAELGVCYGQAQTRNCSIRDTDIGFTWTGIDTFSYGQATGSPPMVDNLLFVGGKHVLNISTSRGNVIMRNIQAESFCSIGRIRGFNGATFEGCMFKFPWGTSTTGYDPAPDGIISGYDDQGGGSNVTFRGCLFRASNDNHLYFNAHTLQVNVTYDDCTFLSSSIPYSTSNTRFIKCKLGNVPFGFDHLSTVDGVTSATRCYGSHNPLFVNANKFVQGDRQIDMRYNLTTNPIDITVDLATATATFTLPDPNIVNIGQVVFGLGTSGKVVGDSGNYSAANEIVNAYFGIVREKNGSVITIGSIPFYLITGTYSSGLGAFKVTKWIGDMTGNITSGSNVISITAWEGIKNFFTFLNGAQIQNTQFPAGTYVTSVNFAGDTITLSKNATASATGVAIYSARQRTMSVTG